MVEEHRTAVERGKFKALAKTLLTGDKCSLIDKFATGDVLGHIIRLDTKRCLRVVHSPNQGVMIRFGKFGFYDELRIEIDSVAAKQVLLKEFYGMWIGEEASQAELERSFVRLAS